MSIWGHAQAGYRILRALHDVGMATEDGEDSTAGPSQRTYLAESNAEASAEHSRWLVTLTKKKKKKRGQSTIEAKNKKEFNSRKHVLEILHKPGI